MNLVKLEKQAIAPTADHTHQANSHLHLAKLEGDLELALDKVSKLEAAFGFMVFSQIMAVLFAIVAFM